MDAIKLQAVPDAVASKSQEPDAKLMQRYCAGDSRAFDALYLKHKDGVYRYMYRHCGQKNIVEELVQDTWMRLVDKREQFVAQQGSSFAAYLYRIAHNRLVDHYRRMGLENDAFSQQDDEQLQNYAEKMPEVSEQLHHRRQLDKLIVTLDELPVAQRDAFLLHEEGGLTLADIAELHGVPRETIKSRLRYAFARIRKALAEPQETQL